MDKDRVAGSAKKTKGSVKEAIGKVTGDSKTQVEGAAALRGATEAEPTAAVLELDVRDLAVGTLVDVLFGEAERFVEKGEGLGRIAVVEDRLDDHVVCHGATVRRDFGPT